MTRDTGSVDFAVAFALGVLVGAGLAVLFAPDSGDKTRKRLGKRSRRWKKEAGKQLDAARGTSEAWLDEAEDVVEEWTSDIARAVEDGVRTIRDAAAEEMKGLDKKLGRKKGLFR